MSKVILSAVIIIMAVTSAFGRGRTLPTGPADYIDDNGFYHSLYSDWPGIQGPGIQGARVSSSHRRHPSHGHGDDASDR
jgi:hypothetical protein